MLCLGSWSLEGLIRNHDVTKVASLPDIKGNEVVFVEGWGAIYDNIDEEE